MSIARRSSYKAAGTQDAIIAPLLGDEIVRGLADLSARLPRGFRTLDVGAGESPLRSEVEGRGAQYRSLDITQNSAGTINYVGRIDSVLPPELLQEKQFDLLVCTEVLEHVPDWSQAFRNFHTLLRPGGYLLLTCPFFYMLHEEPHDYWRPTNHALRLFAEKNGFSVTVEKRLGNAGDALGTMLGSLHVQRRRKILPAYLPAAALQFAIGILRKIIRWNWIRGLISIEGRFYLSNLMILQKEEKA